MTVLSLEADAIYRVVKHGSSDLLFDPLPSLGCSLTVSRLCQPEWEMSIHFDDL